MRAEFASGTRWPLRRVPLVWRSTIVGALPRAAVANDRDTIVHGWRQRVLRLGRAHLQHLLHRLGVLTVATEHGPLRVRFGDVLGVVRRVVGHPRVSLALRAAAAKSCFRLSRRNASAKSRFRLLRRKTPRKVDLGLSDPAFGEVTGAQLVRHPRRAAPELCVYVVRVGFDLSHEHPALLLPLLACSARRVEHAPVVGSVQRQEKRATGLEWTRRTS